jgi:hypothetical protein
MKFKLSFTILLALALPSFAMDALAQSYSVYSTGNTLVSDSLSTATIGMRSSNGGTPLLTYLNATGDTSTSCVTFYACKNKVMVNYTNTATSIPVDATNGFSSGDVILIQHIVGDKYEERKLAAFTGQTNLTTTLDPTLEVTPGDVIYRVVPTATIPVGSNSISISGPGIFSGQRGLPLLMDITGSAAVYINAACATMTP